MKNKKALGFTLIELIVILSLISFSFITILFATHHALDNIKGIRQRVIAINLAREGIE
jgi:type II secretory pathway pseudopilin PulG